MKCAQGRAWGMSGWDEGRSCPVLGGEQAEGAERAGAGFGDPTMGGF